MMRRVALFIGLVFVAACVSAQSIYPGQHKGKLAVEDMATPQVLSFDLKDVRLLPSCVRDNLERDSAWMATIPAAHLLHSFRNNAGVYAGVEGGYESVQKLGGWESLDCDLRGHTTGHMLSACALMYAATGAENFKAKGEIFDYAIGTEGERAMIRLPRNTRKVKAVLYAHQNMTEEVLFRSECFRERMDSLGVAMAFIQRGSQNWDVADGCQERFERIMSAFAQGTGHPELADAKIIPFGHSAQATFPWNFAAWNPERTLCILSFHGDAPRTNLCGYGRANVEWGRTRNIDRIPALMVMGEYEWWDARLRPALAFRMMYPDSRISFLCDAGRGHFDLCEETMEYMAKFIEKSLQDPRPKGGKFYSCPMPDNEESDDVHEQFWYHDEEMVALTKARYESSKGKKMQYVSAQIDGELLKYNPASHIKINMEIDKPIFRLEPVFVNENREEISADHAQVRPKITIISGPVKQIGEYTFEYDPSYFGKDPKRLWSGITLCVEADGDTSYKSAVQELNIRLNGE